MGPLRRGLIAATLLLPTRAMAEVCDKIHPGWDGVPATIWDEFFLLSLSPISLILLGISLLSLRLRKAWLGLISVVLWTAYASLLTMADPGRVQSAARLEGCAGSPALFIAAVAAICIATILYTAPHGKRTT